MRLAKEAASPEEIEASNFESEMESSGEEEKVYTAMGVAKTIGTVSFFFFIVVGLFARRQAVLRLSLRSILRLRLLRRFRRLSSHRSGLRWRTRFSVIINSFSSITRN